MLYILTFVILILGWQKLIKYLTEHNKMQFIEKIISILEWGSGKDNKTYTEEEMARFAKDAYLGATGAFLIPILIVAPFHYAPKAKKSSNSKTVDKAKRAEQVGLFYITICILLTLYIIAIN